MKKQSNYTLLIILSCSIFSIFFNASSMTNLIRIIAEHYNMEFKNVSKLLSYYSICYGFSALISSYLNVKISKKYTLFISLSFFSILNFLIFFSDSFTFIIFFRSLSGIFASFMIPTSLSYIAEYSKNKGKKTGLLFSTTSIAGMTGMMLSGFVHWKIQFLIPACLSGINAFLVIIFLEKETISKRLFKSVTMLTILKKYFTTFIQKPVFKVLITIFINSFLLTSVYSYFAFYFGEIYGINKEMIAIILTCGVVGGIIGNISGGFLLDHSNILIVELIGTCIISIGLMVLSFAPIFRLIFLVMISISLGRTFFHITLVNKFINFPAKYRKYVTSLNSFLVFSAGSSGIMFFNFIHQFLKYKYYLRIISLIYCIIFLIFLVFTIKFYAQKKAKTS